MLLLLGLVLLLLLLLLWRSRDGIGRKGATGAGSSLPASSPELPVLVPQNGHAGEVTAVAVSPDRRFLATGGSDGTMLMWDLEHGRASTSLSVAPGEEIQAMAFAGGTRLAVAEGARSIETRLRLWDLATAKAVRAFVGHPWSLEIGLAVSSDGALLAAIGGGRLTLWETTTGDLWVQLAAAGADAVFLGDRRLLFRTSDSLVVLDVVSGPPALRVLPTGPGQAFAVSQDGATLAHAAGDQVTFWDLTSASLVGSQRLLSDVWSLAFYNGRRGVLAGDRGGRVYRLRGERWEDVVGFLNLGAPVTGMAPLGEGKVATSRRRDGTIMIWAVDAASPVRRLGFPSPAVTALDLARDGSLLVAGDAAGTVRVWDLAAGAEWIAAKGDTDPVDERTADPGVDHVEETIHTGPLPFPDQAPIRSLRLSSAGLVLVRDSGSVEVWSVELRERTFAAAVADANDALTREGECLVVAGGASVQRFEVADGTSLEPWPAPAGASALALSSDGKRVAVSGADAVVVVDEHGEVVDRFPGLSLGTGARLTFLASGEALLRSTREGVERLDLGTGRVVREAASGHGVVAPIASLRLSGGRDGRLRRWAPAGSGPQLELPAHAGAITAMVVSEGGGIVVTGGEDAAIKVWQSDGLRLLAHLQLLPGKDWLAFSPNGFFEGSPAAWAQASFHYPSEPLRVYAPEQFFAIFFQPDLLRDVITAALPIEEVLAARGDARASQRFEAARRSRIPIVRILSPRETVQYETGLASEGTWVLKDGRSLPAVSPRALGSVVVTHARVTSAVGRFEAEIRDTGSGVGDCRVFHNRALIHDHRGPFAVDATTRTGRMQVDFEVVAGPNELSAYCFSEDDVRSEIVRVTIEGDRSLQRRGKAYIVAAGGDAYTGNLRPLRYAAADATFTLDVLRSSLEAAGRYDVVPVLLYGGDATRKNLLAALDRLGGREGLPQGVGPAALGKLAKARLEDAVFIFFAGHGSANGDRYVLYPVDATGGPRATGGITDLELEAALRGINAGHLILILDTCQSGQLLAAEESRRGPLNTRGFAQLAYEKQLQVLAAAQSYQLAYEDNDLSHGMLTYALIHDGLDGFLADVAPPDRTLRSREWLRYALRRVPELQGVVARARLARGQAFFPSGGPIDLRIQQPQVYLPAASADSLVIAARPTPAGATP